ncbi:TenA family protein [Amycolatopsis rubida]|uniref:Thiaminase (Transcriptional activator TenA) n=1 Tax=Amycolatopsis rubida TaxID=112413 RepID=A0A1I5TMJ2_9PSEU|nr:TenA family transcriptional regulator [Amycolatopsis rubida]SFP84260.1 thiaminase (transcriptional activator TenA) [Amycolatopsis rubida]
MHEELLAKAEPLVAEVAGHPFWAGLRDGSLPEQSLAHFVRQDTDHLLPACARALARCAAIARHDEHVVLLGQSVIGTLSARDRLRERHAELFGTSPWRPADHATRAHCSFFTAASAIGVAAGIGALLPMVWFNHKVSDDLVERCAPGSRYSEWIRSYHPGEGYAYAVRSFLGMVDRIGEEASAAEREELVDHFTVAARYEWTFAETAWRRTDWPVR